jgi:hypothetical protein
MGRAGPNDSSDVSLVRFDDDLLAEEHLVPPAAQGVELEASFLGDVVDHKADLIHVTGQHHPRASLSLAANQAADAILLDGAQGFQALAHESGDLGLVSRDAVRLRKFS